jgi:hypothetical protein
MRPTEIGPGALAGATEAGVFIAGRQFAPNTTIASHSPPRQSADALRRLRWKRYAEAIHPLGARVEFEIWDEIARHHPDLVDDIDQRLGKFAKFAALDPNVLRVLGADRFPSSPIRAVSP